MIVLAYILPNSAGPLNDRAQAPRSFCDGRHNKSQLAERDRSRRKRSEVVYGYARWCAVIHFTPVALATFTPPGTWRPVWAIVALGIFTAALGHTLYNAALRRTHATYVNLIATQEVTGGIILGYLFLGEVPSFNSFLGAAITLIGIAMVLI